VKSMKIDRVRFLGAKKVASRIIASKLAGRFVGSLFPRWIHSRGMRIFYPPWLPAETKAMLFWGIYESAEIRFVQKYLRDDLHVIELGSGIGYVSSMIGRKIAKGRKLVCVECDPRLSEWIDQNVRTNAGTSPHLMVGGMYYFCDRAIVEAHTNDNFLVNQVGRVEDTLDVGSQTVDVPRLTLTEIRIAHGIDGAYQLVSDIEGGEVGFLLEEDLSRCRIFIAEFHEGYYGRRHYSVDDLIDLAIEKHNFRLIRRYGAVCAFYRA
jgi:FkbM family methyltransferase